MEPEVLDRIPRGRRVSVERETFPQSCGRKNAVRDDQDTAYWIDTGTPEAYLQAQRDLLSGLRGEPPTPGASRSPGGAWQLGTPRYRVRWTGPHSSGTALSRRSYRQGVGRGSGWHRRSRRQSL